MSFLATLPLPHLGRTGDLLITAVFLLYTMVCFVRVAGYASVQLREGRMIDLPRSPRRFTIAGPVGWMFAACVLALLFCQSALYMILVVVGLAGLLIEGGTTAREQFGLARLPLRLLAKWSLLVCGAVIFIEFPLSWLIDRTMNILHLPHPEQESVEMFRHFTRPGEILAFLLQAVLLSPLLEELFFRGFLLTFLKNYTSTGFAIVLSAGVFAFAHANLGSVIQLWLLGLALGLAYEHSGALLLPFGIHACWNLFTALSLLLERST